MNRRISLIDYGRVEGELRQVLVHLLLLLVIHYRHAVVLAVYCHLHFYAISLVTVVYSCSNKYGLL